MMDAEQRLSIKGLKPTAMRLLVLRALQGVDAPVSLADLCEELDTADKSTVFRILTLFHQHHIVHAIEDGSGSLKYELCAGEHDCTIEDMHVHFYCERCQRTFCLDDVHIPQVALPAGFSQNEVNYMVKGLCKDCRDSGV